MSLAVPPAVDERPWGFPLHAACWRIIEEVYSPAIPDVQFLLGFCWSFPVYLGIMNWGHDYGGSIRYEEKPAGLDPGEETYILPPAEGGPERCGPLDITELRHVFEHPDGICNGSRSIFATIW